MEGFALKTDVFALLGIRDYVAKLVNFILVSILTLFFLFSVNYLSRRMQSNLCKWWKMYSWNL